MSIYTEINNLDLKELINCFHDVAPDGEEYAASYYAEVALLIAQQGQEGISFLKSEIDLATTEKLRAIILALTTYQFNDPNLIATLYMYLSDERPLIVTEAIDGLSRQEIKDGLDKVLALLKHPSPYVRGSVLRFMKHLYPKESLPILIEALQDTSFIVRENAVDELGELEMIEVIPHLRPLLTDQHPDVRQAAKFAIETLESNFQLDQHIISDT